MATFFMLHGLKNDSFKASLKKLVISLVVNNTRIFVFTKSPLDPVLCQFHPDRFFDIKNQLYCIK
jgi:hypothetical protein